MEAAHRWHLEMAIRSESIGRLEEAGQGLPGQTTLSVAFADMVGFTAASDHLSAGEIGAIASSFMSCAEATLPDNGARIVKGIGDAVMFTAPDAVTAGRAAVALVKACAARREPELPPVRAGGAHGPVLPRYADYFGRTVNIASRLCGEAPPQRVLLLEPDPAPSDSEWHRRGVKVLRRRRLRIRGIEGRLPALELGSA
jgi:adenylate cyclase